MTDSRAEQTAAVVFTGGPILTMAHPARPEAVATRGARIIAVGTLAQCRNTAGPGATEIDLAGRALA